MYRVLDFPIPIFGRQGVRAQDIDKPRRCSNPGGNFFFPGLTGPDAVPVNTNLVVLGLEGVTESADEGFVATGIGDEYIGHGGDAGMTLPVPSNYASGISVTSIPFVIRDTGEQKNSLIAYQVVHDLKSQHLDMAGHAFFLDRLNSISPEHA